MKFLKFLGRNGGSEVLREATVALSYRIRGGISK